LKRHYFNVTPALYTNKVLSTVSVVRLPIHSSVCPSIHLKMDFESFHLEIACKLHKQLK